MDNTHISIIIPTKNRQEILWVTVEKALYAIENNDVEIIVVNDDEIALTIPDKLNGSVQVYNNPRNGVSSARNFGASMSKGNILFFLDDDMWITTQAIEWIRNIFQQQQSQFNAYNINWEYPPSLNQKLKDSKIGRFLLNTGYNQYWGRMHEKGQKPSSGLYKFHSIASGSLVIHDSIFKKVGGYNESLIFQGEDIDLSKRLKLASIPVYVVFDTTIFHNQQDRLNIYGHLERLRRGYHSEFEAAYNDIINFPDVSQYINSKRILFELFSLLEYVVVFIYRAIPNQPIFSKLTNKLIGILSGLIRFQEWKKVSMKYNK